VACSGDVTADPAEQPVVRSLVPAVVRAGLALMPKIIPDVQQLLHAPVLCFL
jgi:hypothetical protein